MKITIPELRMMLLGLFVFSSFSEASLALMCAPTTDCFKL